MLLLQMATVPVIICFGNSNTDGFAALSDVPAADFARWTGTTLPTTYPIDISVPDVYCWTPKMPYGVRDTRNILTVGTNTVNISVPGGGTAPTAHEWVYVKTNATGQGQMRRITTFVSPLITVDGDWSPPLTPNDGTIELWTDSHTCEAASTPTAIEKKAATVAFTAGIVGKWFLPLSGGALGSAAIVQSKDGDHTLTLDRALSADPADGDGFIILTGSNSVDELSDYLTANASWRNLTFYYDQSYSYGTGYDYPNWKSLPRYAPVTHLVGGATVNFVPELAWHFKAVYDAPVYVIHLALPATWLLPYSADLPLSDFSWFDVDLHHHFHPGSTTDLYSLLTSKILTIAMAQIQAGGNTPDIVGIFSTIAEKESTDAQRAARAGEGMALLRDSLRAFIADSGWSQMRAERIPWIMADVGPDSSWTYSTIVNEALAQLAQDDPFTGVVDADDLEYEADNVHYSGEGMVTLGQQFFAKWKEAISAQESAMEPADQRLTLAQLRTKIRRRYERNGSGTDDTNSQVLEFLNDSIREISLTLGDNAWWLRRATSVTFSGVYPSTVDLPRDCARLVRLESSSYPGSPLPIKGIAYTDNGRQQVTLHGTNPGGLVAHWMIQVRDLVNDADPVPLPIQLTELAVVLTCKRLAEVAGNMTIAQYYAIESQRLWQYAKKEAHRYQRFRNEGMALSNTYDHWREGESGSTIWGL